MHSKVFGVLDTVTAIRIILYRVIEDLLEKADPALLFIVCY